jgi:hypothetical protein
MKLLAQNPTGKKGQFVEIVLGQKISTTTVGKRLK